MTEQLMVQYGVLGIIAVILWKVFYNHYKALVNKNKELEIKVDDLQTQMQHFIIQDRERLLKVMEDNSVALRELRTTITLFLGQK